MSWDIHKCTQTRKRIIITNTIYYFRKRFETRLLNGRHFVYSFHQAEAETSARSVQQSTIAQLSMVEALTIAGVTAARQSLCKHCKQLIV